MMCISISGIECILVIECIFGIECIECASACFNVKIDIGTAICFDILCEMIRCVRLMICCMLYFECCMLWAVLLSSFSNISHPSAEIPRMV